MTARLACQDRDVEEFGFKKLLEYSSAEIAGSLFKLEFEVESYKMEALTPAKATFLMLIS